jgi:hypothetical protein
VRDVELVLVGALAPEIERREVPIEVGQGLGEVERRLLGSLTQWRDRIAAQPVELEELADTPGRGLGLELDRPGEALEPLEIERVRAGRGRELPRRGRVLARLREELGVLLEDLDALLFFFVVR